jgi:hypothetical protein
MRRCLRVCFPAVMLLSIGSCLWAQEQTVGAATAQGAKKVVAPARKNDQVITDDPIALLAVQRDASSVAQTTKPTADTRPDADTALGSLEKLIKEKQSRIVLLLRLFVDDEKKFVMDPTNPAVDAAAKERRKYEQDELLYETAELAKLKARWEQLKSPR